MPVIDLDDCDKARKFILTSIIPEVELYANCVRGRFLPCFDLDSLKEEADYRAKKPYEDFLEEYKYKSEDPPEDGFEIFDAISFGYYEKMVKIGQGFTNLFAAGLYHVFEQHLKSFYVESWLWNVIRPPWLSSRRDKENFEVDEINPALQSLEGNGVLYKEWPCWNHIDELRLVANTIKHGKGYSSNRLEKKKPEIFQHPSLRNHPLWPQIPPEDPSFRHGEYQRTVTGDHIFITLDDLNQYEGAIHEFWMELSATLPLLAGKTANEPPPP